MLKSILIASDYNAGFELYSALMLLAMCAPPTLMWLKRRRWRFGLRGLMVAVIVFGLLCSFCSDDLQIIDRFASDALADPVWYAREVLLPM